MGATLESRSLLAWPLLFIGMQINIAQLGVTLTLIETHARAVRELSAQLLAAQHALNSIPSVCVPTGKQNGRAVEFQDPKAAAMAQINALQHAVNANIQALVGICEQYLALLQAPQSDGDAPLRLSE